jgi:hypothetical protein
MKIIKKYTAIQLGTQTVNDSVEIKLTFGEISGPYYDRTEPKEEFDSEDEAIKYAYNENEYSRWLIVPIISFNHFED